MSVEVTTLPNGLRVATDCMAQVETVSVGTWVDVGTRFEEEDLNGISHLIEHMAFKGTARRNAGQIAEEIEAVGGMLNASTSRENTAYYAKVLKEDLSLAVDVIADIVQNPALDADELARERDVIVQEISQVHDTPDDIIFDLFQNAAYPNQPLGRPVLGTSDLVQSMPRSALVGYLDDHYRAPNMILAAAGNLDHDQLVRLAEQAFPDSPQNDRKSFVPAHYQGGNYREERDLGQLHLVLGFQAIGYKDPDFYALSVLSTLLGGGMSSRLFQEIREKRGLVYSVFTDVSCYLDGGLFSVYAGTSGDKGAEITPLICDEILRVMDDLNDEEIQRARAQLKASILMSLESTSSRCGQMARQIAVFDRPLTTQEIVAEVEAVDRTMVIRTMARLLASKPTVAALGAIQSVPDYGVIADRLSA